MFGSDNIAAALETMRSVLSLKMHKNATRFQFVVKSILFPFFYRHDFHFPGHLVPGTAFMILGIWWSWSALKIYRENERRKYSDSLLKGERNEDVPDLFPFLATYNGEAAGTFRCEGFYKVRNVQWLIRTFINKLFKKEKSWQVAYASYDLFCHFLAVIYGGDLADEWQHMTVYVFFILNGIIDVIAHKRIYKLPKGTEYLGSAIAWAALGMLFISHTHGKTKIAVFYHQQFGWLAVSIAVITLLQWKYDQNILIALTRSSCVTFAGTWLYQVC